MTGLVEHDILGALPPDLRALSLGAGVQSTTLALLAVEGVLPKPDVAIFADTGWEPAAVYEHLDRLAVVLADAGIELIRVAKGNLRTDMLDPGSRYASVPYFVLAPEGTKPEMTQCRRCDGEGECTTQHPAEDADGNVIEGTLVAMTYTCPACDGGGEVPTGRMVPLTRNDREGMGRRQCTSEYKLGPIQRKVRELLGAAPPDYRRVPKGRVCEQWIGFSTDEIGRVSDHNGVSYVTKRYPLLDLGMSRSDCIRWLAVRGWGSTTKSACIGCPYHGNRQWRELRDTCECGHSRRSHRGDEEQGWTYCQGSVPSGPAVNLRDDGKPCECARFNAPEWADAVEFDHLIRKGGSRGPELGGDAFLHRSRVPLPLAPIDRVTRAEWNDRQGDMLEVLADQSAGYDPDEDGDPDGCSPFGCRSGEPA